jgi:uncharacterized protein
VAAAAGLWWLAYAVNRPVWEWVVFDAAGLDPGSRVGSAVEFFVYDTTKILLLLAGIIFVVTVLRSFMSVERTRALLGGRREGSGTWPGPASVSSPRSVRAARCPGSSGSSPPGSRSGSR